jgi:hypothetical protein
MEPPALAGAAVLAAGLAAALAAEATGLEMAGFDEADGLAAAAWLELGAAVPPQAESASASRAAAAAEGA